MRKKNQRVFVVDDFPDMTFHKAVGLYLQTEDVVHQTPDSLHEADIDESVDYVILDIMMYWGKYLDIDTTERGYLTGFALLSEVHEKCPKAKIIILTALHGEMFESLKDEAGSYDFVTSILQKPQSVKSIFRDI